MQKTQKIIIGLLCTGSIGVMILAGCPGENKPGGGNLANPIINPQATVDDVKLSFMNVKDAIKKYVKSNEKKLDKILYMSPYSSSGSSRIKIFGYESDNNLLNYFADLFYPQKGLHISGEYTDKVYFYDISRNYDSREEGTITYTTDEKDLLKNVVIKDSSNTEFLRLNYSLIDNPSITGATTGHTIKGANVDVKFHDSMCNNGTLNGNVIVAGEFEQQYNSIKAVSAIQLALNGKCDTQNMNFTGSAYDFAPQQLGYGHSNIPGTVKATITYPGYILSQIDGNWNYDWKNTKNIAGNANFTFNNEYWSATLNASDYVESTSTSSFPYRSVRGTLENTNKNYIISVQLTPVSKIEYYNQGYGYSWDWGNPNEWNFSGEITSDGKKLADISIKEVSDKYGYKVKTPVITYTDGTELNLSDYGKELSEATGISAPAPVVRPSAYAYPSASAVPSATVAPTVAWSEYPYAYPSASVAPSASVVPTVAPTPGASAYPSYAVSPSAVPQNGTTVRIYVMDDNSNYIDGATVIAELLVTGAGTFANGTLTDTVTASNGNAVFNGVPAGVQIQYTVSKTGYTTRTLVYSAVTGTNDIAYGNSGIYNAYGGANYALSDSPEVTAIEPGYNTTGVSPTASFKLTFSEDVDQTSVEDGFLIETNTDQTTPFTVGATFGNKGTDVYDRNSHDIYWNGYNEVTFSPKSGYPLPTDKDSNKVPQYRVTWKNTSSPFRDRAGTYAKAISNPGTSYETGPFRVTSTWKGSVPFTVCTDTTASKVDSITVSSSNTIKIRFNEPMALYPLGATGNFYHSNLFNGSTYEVSISNDGVTYNTISNAIGTALMDGADTTDKTIKLTTNFSLSSYSNKTLKVKIILPLSDPAGNEIVNNTDKFAIVVVPVI